MDGIRFLTDETGAHTAVVIDLAVHGDLWDDFYDILLAEEREGEPRESLEEVRGRLEDQGIIPKGRHEMSIQEVSVNPGDWCILKDDVVIFAHQDLGKVLDKAHSLDDDDVVVTKDLTNFIGMNMAS